MVQWASTAGEELDIPLIGSTHWKTWW